MNKKLLFSVVVAGISCVAYSSAFISKSQSEVGLNIVIDEVVLTYTC